MTRPTYAIAADIGGTNLRVALVRNDGYIEDRAREATGSEPIASLFSLIDAFLLPYESRICGIGVAVAGIIDRDRGIILRSPNIPQLSGVRLHSLISSRYKKPVVIENDANAAALGEKWKGSGAAFQSFVLFTLGTGIGGGMVIGSELVPVAAEIGHMTINAEGLRCSCGNKGCLETVASATAIVSKTVADMERGAPTLLKERHSWNFSAVRAEDVYKAAKDGDALCQKVLREAGQGLGIGIANAINLMSPDAVILTGGLASAQDFYVEEAIREAAKRALPELYEKSEIIPSALEGDAGIFGAARLAFINSA